MTDGRGKAKLLGGSFVCLLKLSTIPVPTIATTNAIRTMPPPSNLRMGAAKVLDIHAIAAMAINPRRSASDSWHTMPRNAAANV